MPVRCPGISSRDIFVLQYVWNSVYLCPCVYCSITAECIVGGIKPSASVDSPDLLALMGCMNSECWWLEREGGFTFSFFLWPHISEFSKSFLTNSRLCAEMKIWQRKAPLKLPCHLSPPPPLLLSHFSLHFSLIPPSNKCFLFYYIPLFFLVLEKALASLCWWVYMPPLLPPEQTVCLIDN